MRHESDHKADSTAARIAAAEQRGQRRAERKAMRAAMRLQALAEARASGDAVTERAIDKKIAAATQADNRRIPAAQREARKTRLAGLGAERDQLAWQAAERVAIVANDDQVDGGYGVGMAADRCGDREHASIVGMSPTVMFASCSDGHEEHPAAHERSSAAMTYMIARAASMPNHRRRPLRHAVIVLPESDRPMATQDAEARARAVLLLRLSSADDASGDWMLLRHDGSDGKGQGSHYHVCWIDTGSSPGGHAQCAVAARAWARSCGEEEAAQGPSLATGAAGRRDWDRLPSMPKTALARPTESLAGGLWLQKSGWHARDAEQALTHLLGRD